jgi:hypothetical protein
MPLPAVGIAMHSPGDPPTVTVGGVLVAGVRSVQVTAAQDHLPQVSLVLTAASVDVQLPAGVTVLQTGPGVTDFAEQLNPARLEGLALARMDETDATTGEAFAAAVAQMADEYAQARA